MINKWKLLICTYIRSNVNIMIRRKRNKNLHFVLIFVDNLTPLRELRKFRAPRGIIRTLDLPDECIPATELLVARCPLDGDFFDLSEHFHCRIKPILKFSIPEFKSLYMSLHNHFFTFYLVWQNFHSCFF